MNDAANSEFNAIMSKLKGDSKQIVTIMMQEFSKLRNEFSESLRSKTQEIDQLKSQVGELRQKVDKLETNLDDADAYERRDTLIISGSSVPAATTGENCSSLVQNLARSALSIELPLTEINTVHRLGKKPDNQVPDKRPIILKLCRRDTKHQLVSAARRMRPSNLFVNESLTAPRRKILHVLRMMKRSHPNLLNGCSSYDGNIYAYTKDGSSRNQRHLVNSYPMLVAFTREHIRVPIETFLDSWEF